MNINETGGNLSRIGMDPGRQASKSARVSETGASDFDAILQVSAKDTENQIPEQMPSAIWSEIDRAAQLVDALAARGQQIRFDTDPKSGKVAAGLYTDRGRMLQDIPLGLLIPDPSSPATGAAAV